MPYIPGPPKVVDQSKYDQEIAKEGCQDRRAQQAFVVIEMENVDSCGGYKPTGGEADAAEHIKSNP
jgi:hypothetical protein